MISLDFYNKTTTKLGQNIFNKLLDSAHKELVADGRLSKKEDWLVELSLVGTKAITQLNTQYHNKTRPTDVVSVSYFQDMFENGSTENDFSTSKNGEFGSVPSPLAGEIFISLPYARVQAKQIGQSLNDELQFLFVHGLLHVFGYDHMKPTDESHMLRLTYKILGRK